MRILFGIWLVVVLARGVRDTWRLVAFVWRKALGRVPL